MSDNTKVQFSFKTSDRQDATLVNIYADTPDQIPALLAAVRDNAGALVEARAAVTLAHGGIVGTPVQQEQQAPPQQFQQAQPQQEQPRVQYSQQRRGGKNPPPAQVGMCDHGQRNRVSKPNWTADFCPIPKDSPGSCKAQFYDPA